MSEHHQTKEWARVRSTMKPRLAAEIAAGRGQCIDCGGAIAPDTPLGHWQVGHRVGVAQAKAAGWTEAQINAASNLGPSHSKASGRACNQIAGGRVGGATTARARQKKEGAHQGFFEESLELTPGGREGFSRSLPAPAEYALEEFAALPERPEYTAIPPRFHSTTEGYERGRDDFYRGAALLGLGHPEDPRRKMLQPVQYVVADILNAQDEDGAPIHVTTGFSIPRRASKTTSVWAVVLGRLSDPEREDYQVGYTAQTQVKARERFLKDVVAPITKQYPDPSDAPFIINRGAGTTSLTWKSTGSRITVLSPIGDSWRGDGYDMAIIDEAQKIVAGDDTADLLSGIMPTFDTKTINGKPAGQLVVLGTAGPHKSGLFWEQLEKGRKGKAGILEYSADPRTPDYDPDDEEQGIEGTTSDPEVWRTAHPGMGLLTPEVTIAAKHDDGELGLEGFKREYLGIWPDQDQTSFIDLKKWEMCRVTGPVILPEHFSIAVSVHFQQASAAIVAGWRDENDLRHIAVLDYREGTAWVADRLDELAAEHKVPIVYDDISATTKAEIAAMSPRYPRAKTAPQKWANIATAAAVTMKAITNVTLRHHEHPAMDKAAAIATKRGSATAGMWAFGDSGGDVTPLRAGSMALRYFDENPPRVALKPPPDM